MTTEKPKKSKPKRTLVQIRAEKAELSKRIDSEASIARTLAKVTPHKFLQSASYQQVLDYKEISAKCADYYVSTNGSTNDLKKKLAKTLDLVSKISAFTDNA